MVPSAACCFTRDSGSAGLFLDISNKARQWDARETTCVEVLGRGLKLQHLLQKKKGKKISCRKPPLNSSSACVVSRTLLPLRFSVTMPFTPDGPPPALVRSVIKCH
ncbi:hypothetical protein CesoFtcFv8_024569 [Champsocephalus esox]|uniref:Uncharacterized protein n=2 Tax=Champsocephalus TaxID=52236 RepID=A0AAN8CGV0_CHAGU|nr:hypothetical protein CesoFtcFv8_024569 [Champsocephalus esox]KAK5901198.1 hypothetical protein CgunFtcFv8_026093 [Champsocephalus gunnari]